MAEVHLRPDCDTSRTYLWQTWFRTTLTVIPFALACAAAERFWPAHNLFVFFLQIAALLPLIPATLVLTFRGEVMTQVREWLRRRRSPSENISREYQTSTTTVG